MRPNYGITRIDQESKRNHGFLVRITHRGETHHQYFPDKSNGGKRKALAMAKKYRDEVLSGMPKEKLEKISEPRRKAPQSGVKGVTHCISKVKSPDGGERRYEYWQAAWNDSTGKRRTSKFSISRYGSDKALDLALKTREGKLKRRKFQLNKNSAVVED